VAAGLETRIEDRDHLKSEQRLEAGKNHARFLDRQLRLLHHLVLVAR
jgi:hypothetical protein